MNRKATRKKTKFPTDTKAPDQGLGLTCIITYGVIENTASEMSLPTAIPDTL